MQKRTVFALGLLALGTGLPAVAQDVPILRQNQVELGGFAGFSYGVDHSRVMGGGNVTYSALSWLLPYAEFSYFPSIQRTATGSVAGLQFKDVYDIPLTDVNFGVHVRVRLPHTRIVPYIVAGAGLLHVAERQQQRYDANYPIANPVTYETTPETPPPTPFPSGTNFAVNFGGGFRYYLNGEHFGLRAETKGYRLTSPPGGSSPFQSSPWIYRATFGIFVQFGR
jgi:hypothetical protein